MFNRNTYLFFLSVFNLSSCFKNQAEAQCSRFHYEEQLLEKMIRLEIKFETLLDNVEKISGGIKEDRRMLSEERLASKQEVEKWITDNEESMAALTKDLRNTFEDNERKLVRMSDDIVEMQNTTLGEISDMINSLKPQTVAFRAHKVSKLNPANNEKIVFTETKLNKGDGYDNSTGVFSIPVNGTYMFMIHFCLQYDKAIYFQVKLQKANVFSSNFVRGNRVNYACYSTQTIVAASAGNTIWIESRSNHGSGTLFEQSPYWENSFSGILIG